MRRPVLPGDVSAAARALLAVPDRERLRLCRRILGGAAEAAAYAGLFGRLHPRWGDGSLSSAARRFPLADEVFLDDPDYLRCTRLVLEELEAVLDAAGKAPAR